MAAKSTLEEFLSVFDKPEVVAQIASELGLTPEAAGAQLKEWMAEVPMAWDTVGRHLRPGLRILEVGAGLGLLSHWLAHEGHDVVALEPIAAPFGFFQVARGVVAETAAKAGYPAPRSLEIEAEELGESSEGPFDFIFSIHVLEHVADLDSVFSEMVAKLAPGGEMVHLCPNYAVPYEPHFRVPLLHGRPELTRRLFAKKIAPRQALWENLEFITHDRVMDLAEENDCLAVFEKGLLYSSLRRLEDDAEFAKRHGGGLISAVAGALGRVGALRLLERLPPRLSSPMCFRVRRLGRGTIESSIASDVVVDPDDSVGQPSANEHVLHVVA